MGIKSLIKVIFFVMLLGMLCGCASAGTVYVSPLGTDEYTSDGTYNVSLTVTNDLGSDTEAKTDYIETFSSPQSATEWFWYIISFRWW